MAQDSRNQLQSQRVRVRAVEWAKLYRLLGVPAAVAERDDVRAQMRKIEELSFETSKSG